MTTRWERFQQEVVHGNVVLNFTSFPKGDLGVYAHAYQQAANSLVKEFRGKPVLELMSRFAPQFISNRLSRPVEAMLAAQQ